MRIRPRIDALEGREIMIKVNRNYLKLKSSYLFSEISKRVASFQAANPGTPIIKLGIGDVTLPLPKACIDALVACGVIPDDHDGIVRRLVIEGGPKAKVPTVELLVEVAS